MAVTRSKRLLTARDVREEAERHNGGIDVPKGMLVTALARDEAHRLGVALREARGAGALPAWSGAAQRGSESPGRTSAPSVPPPEPVMDTRAADVEAVVRRVVTTMLGTGAPPGSPVTHVDGRSLVMPPFPLPGPAPALDCRLEDVVTAEEHGSPIAAGFMSLREGSFPWTLTYDEVEYVLEGELNLGTKAGTVVAKPGDVLYIPKDTDVTFGTPSWVKFFYVTYPAEWSGGEGA